ncbi:cupin domain-containing protein [Chloroflexota bacterium]
MATKANWNSMKGVQSRNNVTRRVFSGKNCMMVLNELLPSAQPNLHQHPHEQLTYIVEGTCRFELGDEVLDMVAGDVILIPPDVPHSLEVTSKEPVLNLDVFSPIREDFL